MDPLSDVSAVNVLFSEEKKDDSDVPSTGDVEFEKTTSLYDDDAQIRIASASTQSSCDSDKYDEEKASDVWLDVPVHNADAGNCLPTPDEIQSSVYHNQSKSFKTSSLMKYCTTKIIIAFVAIAFALFLATILAVSSTPQSSTKATAGTPKNVTELFFSKEYNKTMEYLVAHNISSRESLLAVGSPQYYATSFIANDLLLDAHRRKSPEQVDVYIARYVLSLIYFSFDNTPSQNKWIPRMDFALSLDICNWNEHFLNFTLKGVACSTTTKLPVNLTLIGMNLHGSVPTEIGLLTSLKTLNLENNIIEGTIPTEICRLTNLTRLNLGQNYFRGMVPSCIGHLTKLERLYLHKNDLTDYLPESMGQLKALQHLVVSDNVLSGDPTEIWNQLVGLHVLLADENMFSSLMNGSFLSDPENITWLDLSNNDFVLKDKKPFPIHLFQMSNLEVLDFSENRLGGTFPSNLPPNNMLKYLSFYKNSMAGGLHELTNLKAIQHLDVSNNEFTGTIRPEFGQLSDLRLLFMGDNDFLPGPLPSSFANLSSLEDLSLRNSEIYDFFNASHLPKSLVYLDLGSNHMFGNVTSELGNLKRLEVLILNDNQNITGAIPPSITNLQKLRIAFLDGTSLTSGFDQICSLPMFSASTSLKKVVAYADCGRGGDDDVEVDCDCCQCCADLESKGRGCSISYQLNLRNEWSDDFQALKFTVTNETVFFIGSHERF